ncbi:MAG: hypothetical protein GEV28_18620 [Actinophytocola sp.]|uniref:hypothetical protein n=1 Tax=Actinophytocola sp. TaxID=1872138 RepID=UPI001322BD21|nr:hypothetical protein [Actinophytocola sp.]MPZ82297.1 hypothetical protein [Actinophytocola sp.]
MVAPELERPAHVLLGERTRLFLVAGTQRADELAVLGVRVVTAGGLGDAVARKRSNTSWMLSSMACR